MGLWSNVPNRTSHINGTWDSGDPKEDGKYNLWQNTHYDWVRDDDVLKKAVLEAKEINPFELPPTCTRKLDLQVLMQEKTIMQTLQFLKEVQFTNWEACNSLPSIRTFQMIRITILKPPTDTQ